MSDAVFVVCLITIIILVGAVAVLLVITLMNYSSDKKTGRKEVPEVYSSPTSVGRYWHIEIWNATTNRMYSKDFCGQVMLGRSTPTTEPFWQMRIGDDKTISKEQCVVYDRSGFLVVENVSQINVTLLNGYPVTMPMLIQEGCQLNMGSNVFYISKIRRVA